MKDASIKLAYVKGMMQATIGSITNYSAEALIDRMRFLLAYIDDDSKGLGSFGHISLREQQSQHPDIYGDVGEILDEA